MRGKEFLAGIGFVVLLGATGGCGSSSKQTHTTASAASGLGGAAPQQLVGTFKTTLTRDDAARAPRPSELPIGPWTLVIGNSGGPGNSRAVGVGNGDTDRVVHRFGVKGNVFAMACTDDQGLPASGSEAYAWSIRGRKLIFSIASARCGRGDANTQTILTSHPWIKQAAG
jgi:hypothetical protein